MTQGYEQRMKDERLELSEKIDKLKAFQHTQEYNRLYSIDRRLMEAQLSAMLTYETILDMRVSRLD